ncbi:LysR family transcriptional regulator [Isoptericola sp. AK164]|uniref:LysR family transcriptional regulator n=1 Tax=Isoptericola sp. AK164 TaxID=3024246 RepID=UPI0024186FD1|nr:LysR family transcriptional regulator [Isoptericola sp. AK164]
MHDLTPLHSLVAVVDHGSVAAAARQSGYSAPAVSRHLAQLERSLGLTLFERTGRSIRPSVAARVLADKARILIEEADAFRRDARALASGREGVVRLGYFRAAGTTIVPPALADFARHRPGADVQLVERPLSEDVVDLIKAREVDLGFVWGFPEPADEDLHRSLLLRESLVLVTAHDRHDLHEDPGDLSRLVDEPFASAPGHLGAPPHVDRLFLAQGLPTPTATHRPRDHAMLRSLVAAGIVVALLPALGVSDPSPGVRRSVVAPDFRRTYLAHRSGDSNPLLRPLAHAIRASARRFDGFGLEVAGRDGG